MYLSPTIKSQLSHVTVQFGDGAHSFLLSAGATLTELADRIGAIGAEHDGGPISIDIAFSSPHAWPRVQSHPGNSLVH